MDNHLTIRLPKRLIKATLVLALTAAVITPIAASASHVFDDVPDSNTFHEDIAWLADAGITLGCNPPENTNYCPDRDVTRAQMSAFMRRLAENQVVDAATAVTADNADLLDGADSVTYRGRAAATDIDTTATVSPAGGAVATITGFPVPASGGLLIAEGNASFIGGAGPDVGFIWIEVDNGGLCDSSPLPISAGVWQTAANPVSEMTTTVHASATSPGDHRIDLCAVSAVETLNTLTGSLSVQWVEQSEGTSPASSSGIDLGKQLAQAISGW